MRTIALALLLTSCAIEDTVVVSPSASGWSPAVDEVSPPPLILSVSGFAPGGTLEVSVEGANPGDTVWFLRSSSVGPGPCPAGLGGLCLDLKRPILMGRTTADPLGTAEVVVPLPATVVSGMTMHVQALASDGIADHYTSKVVTTTASSGGCPDGNCSLSFDGLNDWVEVPHDPSLDVGIGLTVEAWVWHDTLTNCQTFVRKGVSSSPHYAYWLHKNVSPSDSLYWASYGGFSTSTFGAAPVGRWYHYAGVWDSARSEARTYVDGAQMNVVSASAPTNNAEVLRIGTDWDFGCEMNGRIDEVRISTVARYGTDFVPDTVFAPDGDTMALYHFDAFGGTLAEDSSGNGNHGTIHGATWVTDNP